MSFEETLRGIVREEIRAALKDLQPAIAAAPATSVATYLSAKQAAELAGVRVETVRAWVSSGELPRHGKGRVLRVRREQLEDFLARAGTERKTVEVDLGERARDIVAGRRIGPARRVAR